MSRLTAWIVGVIVATTLSLSLAGCGGAAPYERGNLASPAMDTSYDLAPSQFRTHVHRSREGAVGGEMPRDLGAGGVGGGGGCGCN